MSAPLQESSSRSRWRRNADPHHPVRVTVADGDGGTGDQLVRQCVRLRIVIRDEPGWPIDHAVSADRKHLYLSGWKRVRGRRTGRHQLLFWGKLFGTANARDTRPAKRAAVRCRSIHAPNCVRGSAMSGLTDGRAATIREMDVDRIWSAAELEALTPDVRAATIRAGFVTDPASVPADLIDAARRKADARIAATEGRQARQ